MSSIATMVGRKEIVPGHPANGSTCLGNGCESCFAVFLRVLIDD